jgi:hypothetical protein
VGAWVSLAADVLRCVRRRSRVFYPDKQAAVAARALHGVTDLNQLLFRFEGVPDVYMCAILYSL